MDLTDIFFTGAAPVSVDKHSYFCNGRVYVSEGPVVDGITSERVAGALQEFERSERLLSSQDIAERYAGSWVAAYKGKFVATTADMDSMLRLLKDKNIPSAETAVKFLNRDKDRITIF